MWINVLKIFFLNVKYEIFKVIVVYKNKDGSFYEENCWIFLWCSFILYVDWIWSLY